VVSHEEFPTTVLGQLVIATFALARKKFPDLGQKWTSASWRTGSKIPGSLAMVSVQRVGELDLLCRALENELAEHPPKPEEMDLRDNYLFLYSELWIGAAYAICFALKDRKLLLDDMDFVGLAEDLRLVRVQIEKHQIASDRALADPLLLSTGTPKPDDPPERIYVYDKSNPLRAHIGRTGVSDRRSVMWEVIEAKAQTVRWIDRRTISDTMLNVFTK
jgi:hypothetical protein